MDLSWITLYPSWYLEERKRLGAHYPSFQLDEGQLSKGTLVYYGELLARPKGGSKRHPVILIYPESTPFEVPQVVPIQSLPDFGPEKSAREKVIPRLLDHRHQMPDGSLCLFQRRTRGNEGGEAIRGIDALRRARQWFSGIHTGHWPPDCGESELEPHFLCVGDILVSEQFYSVRPDGRGRFTTVRLN